MKGPPKMDGHKNHHSPKRDSHHHQQSQGQAQGPQQQQQQPAQQPLSVPHPYGSYPGTGPYHLANGPYAHYYGQGSSQNSSPLSSYPPRLANGGASGGGGGGAAFHHNLPPSYKTQYGGGGATHPYTTSQIPYHYLPHSYMPYSANLSSGATAAALYLQLNAKLQELSNRLHSWKAISIGLSFLALILLSCKLYDVDREIHYLQFIATDWLSPGAINRDLLHLPSSSSSNPIPAASSSSNPSSGSSSNPNPGGGGGNGNLYSLMGSHQSISASSSNTNKSDISSILSSTFTSPSSRPPPSSPLSLAMTSPFASSYQNHPHSSSVNSHQNHQNHQQNNNNLQNHRQSSHQYGPYQPIPAPGLLHSEQHLLDNHQQSQPPQSSSQRQPMQIVDPHLQNAIFLMENLREDIEILIVELWSSRTTLVLSLVFVFVYIISWCWMAYAIRETTTPQDISLKTVLLLAIFAAVDIAASAGFVMVRVIMYVMRDYYFPRDMRTPILSAEFNQLAAYAALRLVTLKSSTGVVDIFVSVIVGFLTSLRVYSVICAVSFYRRARKEILNVNNFEYMIEKSSPRLMPSGGGGPGSGLFTNGATPGMAIANGGVKKPIGPTDNANGFIPKMRLLNAHKDLERRFSLAGESDVGSSSDDDPATELKIQAADMPPQMQKSAVQSTVHALRTYSTEKHIAESVKQNFDQMFEPTWHCIVGRNWGSCVTHTKANYIRMLYKDLTILLYKSS